MCRHKYGKKGRSRFLRRRQWSERCRWCNERYELQLVIVRCSRYSGTGIVTSADRWRAGGESGNECATGTQRDCNQIWLDDEMTASRKNKFLGDQQIKEEQVMVKSPNGRPVPPSFLRLQFQALEAGTGIEPVSSGFADRGLTTWLPRQIIASRADSPAFALNPRWRSSPIVANFRKLCEPGRM